MADTCKTMRPSACKRGLWGKNTEENNVTMPHKPRLYALGPIVFCVSAIYEYGVLLVAKYFCKENNILTKHDAKIF